MKKKGKIEVRIAAGARIDPVNEVLAPVHHDVDLLRRFIVRWDGDCPWERRL